MCLYVSYGRYDSESTSVLRTNDWIVMKECATLATHAKDKNVSCVSCNGVMSVVDHIQCLVIGHYSHLSFVQIYCEPLALGRCLSKGYHPNGQCVQRTQAMSYHVIQHANTMKIIYTIIVIRIQLQAAVQ